LGGKKFTFSLGGGRAKTPQPISNLLCPKTTTVPHSV